MFPPPRLGRLELLILVELRRDQHWNVKEQLPVIDRIRAAGPEIDQLLRVPEIDRGRWRVGLVENRGPLNVRERIGRDDPPTGVRRDLADHGIAGRIRRIRRSERVEYTGSVVEAARRVVVQEAALVFRCRARIRWRRGGINRVLGDQHASRQLRRRRRRGRQHESGQDAAVVGTLLVAEC